MHNRHAVNAINFIIAAQKPLIIEVVAKLSSV